MAQNASRQLRSGNRNVAPIPSFNQFQNYGCWCYFTGDGALQGSLHNRRGAGRPVDDMDSYCRDLQWGYDCLLMDADANGYTRCKFFVQNNEILHPGTELKAHGGHINLNFCTCARVHPKNSEIWIFFKFEILTISVHFLPLSWYFHVYTLN